jgi:hypothetical protein
MDISEVDASEVDASEEEGNPGVFELDMIEWE